MHCTEQMRIHDFLNKQRAVKFPRHAMLNHVGIGLKLVKRFEIGTQPPRRRTEPPQTRCHIAKQTVRRVAQTNVGELMTQQRKTETARRMRGIMRLGKYPCVLTEDTHSYALYGAAEISERHRHRFEFNNDYRALLHLEEQGYLAGRETGKRYKTPLRLTDKGRAVGARISARIEAVLAEVSRELTEEERASLYKSLTAISDGLERLAAERKEQ